MQSCPKTEVCESNIFKTSFSEIQVAVEEPGTCSHIEIYNKDQSMIDNCSGQHRLVCKPTEFNPFDGYTSDEHGCFPDPTVSDWVSTTITKCENSDSKICKLIDSTSVKEDIDVCVPSTFIGPNRKVP